MLSLVPSPLPHSSGGSGLGKYAVLLMLGSFLICSIPCVSLKTVLECKKFIFFTTAERNRILHNQIRTLSSTFQLLMRYVLMMRYVL